MKTIDYDNIKEELIFNNSLYSNVDNNQVPWVNIPKINANTSVFNVPKPEPTWTDLVGWVNNITFTPIDFDTLNWNSWTIILADWTTYNVWAWTTWNITWITYLYLDILTTTILTTTTSTDSVWLGKILVWVAKPTVSGKDLEYQIFWTNNQSVFITADNIASNTITGNEIASNTITASQIASWTITTSQLNFTPIEWSNVISSINASSEWIRISGSKIQIDWDVTFSSWYDPTTKITSWWAAADVNANTTTISWWKITTNSITTSQLNFTPVQPWTWDNAVNSSWKITSINWNSITVSNINADNITSWTIATARLDVNNIFAQNITATWTITWALIRTNSNNQRLELSSSLNRFRAMDSSWNEILNLWYNPSDTFNNFLYWSVWNDWSTWPLIYMESWRNSNTARFINTNTFTSTPAVFIEWYSSSTPPLTIKQYSWNVVLTLINWSWFWWLFTVDNSNNLFWNWTKLN